MAEFIIQLKGGYMAVGLETEVNLDLISSLLRAIFIC